ncbi:MAG: hypothetical protein GXY08_06500 [Ruminococcus sp.]|nr:hypothetical protein [Ruminococcus sp.]
MKSYNDSGNDIKKLLPYAAGLLLAAAVIFTVLATTLLSKSYVKRNFSNSRVYAEITGQIREKAEKAYLKTDPPKEVKKELASIISEVITEEAVKKETDTVIDKLLSGREPKMDGSYIRRSIASRLPESLSARHLSLNNSQTNEFIDRSAATATDTIDITKYTDKLPVKLGGGAVRAVLFSILAAAALAGTYILSYNKLLDMGKALLIGGGAVLIAGMIITSGFDPAGMGLPLSSLTKAAEALKSAVTSRCVISGLFFTAAGGAMVFLGKKT